MRFYRDRESSSARALTRFSYLQLTAGIILMLLAKRHYQEEPDTHSVAMATPQQRSWRLKDWCIGEPLIERGWNLNPLHMAAESEEKAAGQSEAAATGDDVGSRTVAPGAAESDSEGQVSVSSDSVS